LILTNVFCIAAPVSDVNLRGKKETAVLSDGKNKNKKLELPPNRTCKYYTAERKSTVKDIEELQIVEICNRKKEQNEEGKLLIRYNSGQRDWCRIEPILCEVPEMVLNYMQQQKLSWDDLQYKGPYPQSDDKEAPYYVEKQPDGINLDSNV
jgi:hypothetical protein